MLAVLAAALAELLAVLTVLAAASAAAAPPAPPVAVMVVLAAAAALAALTALALLLVAAALALALLPALALTLLAAALAALPAFSALPSVVHCVFSQSCSAPSKFPGQCRSSALTTCPMMAAADRKASSPVTPFWAFSEKTCPHGRPCALACTWS